MSTTQHFQGEAAVKRFEMLIGRAFDDDAVGGVFGYGRTPAGTPELVRIEDPREAFASTSEFEMIVIDSGNSEGDAWKYIYHVAAQSGTEIGENA